jgi:hypothetical protein
MMNQQASERERELEELRKKALASSTELNDKSFEAELEEIAKRGENAPASVVDGEAADRKKVEK